MPDTSGPSLPTPLAFYDPDSSSWKTSQGTFLSDSTSCSPTLPASGMTLGGRLYELPTSEPATDVPDCSSLLPTPTSQAAKHAADDRGEGSPDDCNLWSVAARLLPTPRTSDANGTGEHGDGGPDLRTTVDRLLPTPTVSDNTIGYSKRCSDGSQAGIADTLAGLRTGALTAPPSPATPPPSDELHPTLWTDEDGSHLGLSNS